MGHFLYYAPGAKNIQREDFARLGLGHLDGLNPASRQCSHGPGGEPGTVFIAVRPKDTQEHRVGYYPNEQTWIQRTDNLWVGWFNNDIPSPSSIARNEVAAAHDVELCDGNKWSFPCAPALPVAYVFGKNDQTIESRLPKYARLYEIAARIEEIQSSDEQDMDAMECVKMLSEALGVLYHISFIEAGAYGLFSSANWAIAADAILDYPQFRKVIDALREANEKKDSAGMAD